MDGQQIHDVLQWAVPMVVGIVLNQLRVWASNRRKTAQIIRDMDRLVLPHFQPPPPGGVEDPSVPARLERQGHAIAAQGVAIEQHGEELRAHLANEEEATRLLDERLADGGRRMVALEDGQVKILARLDGTGAAP